MVARSTSAHLFAAVLLALLTGLGEGIALTTRPGTGLVGQSSTTRETVDAEAARLRRDWWVDHDPRTTRTVAQYREAAARWHADGDARQEAEARDSLCVFEINREQYQQALDACSAALGLARTARDLDLESLILFHLGVVHTNLREDDAGFVFFNQSLSRRRALAAPAGRPEAFLRLRLGQILRRRNDYRAARESLEQALALSKAAAVAPVHATALVSLGETSWMLGDPVGASRYFQEALQIAEANNDAFRQVRALTWLGVVATKRGAHAEARDFHTRALARLPGGGDALLEGTARFRIAQAEHALGNFPAARTQVETAILLTESIRQQLASDDLNAAFLASRQEYYGLYIDLLMRQHERAPDAGFGAEALAIAERARARSLLDLLAETASDLRQELPPSLATRERETEARVSEAGRRVRVAQAAGAPPGEIEALIEARAAVELERKSLESEVRSRYREYAELVYPTPVTADRVSALLDPRTALLEYALDDTGVVLFAATDRGVHAYRIGGVGEIERLVADVRASLLQPGRREFGRYLRASRRLYELLVGPALEHLRGRETLVIVPDRGLHYLPFETLLTEDVSPEMLERPRGALPYLIKRWAVAYAPSASVLASLRGRATSGGRPGVPSKRLAAFADPPVSRTPVARTLAKRGGEGLSPAGWSLAPLAHARGEVKALAQLFVPREVALFVGNAAREDTVKQEGVLAGVQYVHFATHGLFDDRHPARSALLLTPDPDSGQDGVLEVSEVFNLRLSADLVVLSACQTGLGKDVRGEGVLGLTRAFLYAGAKSVAVSLWTVADQSTAALMTAWYRAMTAGSDRAAALRAAKLSLMKDDRWSHPFFWAPFVLIGDIH